MSRKVNTSEIEQAACLHGKSDFGLHPDRFQSVFYCCLDLPLPVKAGFCLVLLIFSAVRVFLTAAQDPGQYRIPPCLSVLTGEKSLKSAES